MLDIASELKQYDHNHVTYALESFKAVLLDSGSAIVKLIKAIGSAVIHRHMQSTYSFNRQSSHLKTL